MWFAGSILTHKMPMNLHSHLHAVLRSDRTAQSTIRGIPVFLSAHQQQLAIDIAQATGENTWKNFFKRWPILYDILVFFVGPCFFTGLTPPRYLRRFASTGVVLNAGSGVKRFAEHCINVDLFPFPAVDLVADLHSLPFKDNVFSGVICDQVLEHVEDPQSICRELMRVTKPGGTIYAASPFLFPWHPSPSDFTRWTIEGLEHLFPDCEVVERGIVAGPWSAFTAFHAAFFATILSFGSKKIQTILQYVFLVLFFPLKFLDVIFSRFPGAELCAANFFIIVRKRP